MTTTTDSPAGLTTARIAEIGARRAQVQELTRKLAGSGARAFRMSIPPRPDDSDLLLSALCDDVEQLLAAYPVAGRETPPSFGLPPDESPARDAVVALLTAELLEAGETAYQAGESTTLDLRNESAMRGLVRYLTARDGEGRDGPFGERRRLFWERLGAALSAASPQVR